MILQLISALWYWEILFKGKKKKKNPISYVLHFLNNDTTGLIFSLPPDPIHTSPTGAQAHTHELFSLPSNQQFFFGPFLRITQLKQTNNIFMNVPTNGFLFSLTLHIKYLILKTKLH